jgi:hypothetical protein
MQKNSNLPHVTIHVNASKQRTQSDAKQYKVNFYE